MKQANATISAVKELRRHLNENQQEFADRLGLHLRSIAGYETHRKPKGSVLAALSKLACEIGRQDLAGKFLVGLFDGLELTNFHLLGATERNGKKVVTLYAATDDPEIIRFDLAFMATMEDLKSKDRKIRARAKRRIRMIMPTKEELNQKYIATMLGNSKQ